MDADTVEAIRTTIISLGLNEKKSVKPKILGIKITETLTRLSLLKTPATIDSKTTIGKIKKISKYITKAKKAA